MKREFQKLAEKRFTKTFKTGQKGQVREDGKRSKDKCNENAGQTEG